MTKGEKFFCFSMLLTLLMNNPPILMLVNNYAKQNPLTFGWPTFWIWIQFWYLFAIVVFWVSAVKIKRWQKEYREEGGK